MKRTPLALLLVMLSFLVACKEETPPIDQAAADRGERSAESCAACHVLNRKANRVGPHLVEVYGREIGAVGGFDYSDALSAADGTWDAELLTAYIMNPSEVFPGTKMAFGGAELSEVQDIVEYLRSLSK